MALALLPVAHCLDRHFDLVRECSLSQPASRPHLAREARRIAVIDGLLAAVGETFHYPPIGFQAHPHHGRNSRCEMSANALPDSGRGKVNAVIGYLPRDDALSRFLKNFPADQ